MIFRKGIKEQPFFDGYIDGVPCVNCQNKYQNYLVANIKGFFLGAAPIEITAGAYGKKAVVSCNNCDSSSSFEDLPSGQLKDKVQEIFNEKPLWEYNIFGNLIIAFFSLSFLYSNFGEIKDVFISNKNIITNSWELNNVEFANMSFPDLDLKVPLDKKGFINFYSDKTFNFNLFEDKYVSGIWELNSKSLKLFPINTKDTILVNIVSIGTETLKINSDFNEAKQAHLKNFNLILSSIGRNNAFYESYKSENNLWRNKALKSEVESEIKERLINLIQFNVVLFETALKLETKSISGS